MDIVNEILNGVMEAPKASLDQNDVEEIQQPDGFKSTKKGRSWILTFYIYDKNKSEFICTLCRKHLKEGSSGSTGNLHNHMRSQHGDKYSESRSNCPDAKKAKVVQTTLNEAKGKPKEKLTREGFIQRLIKFAIRTDQPFSIVESGDLRELVDYISKDVESTKLIGRTTFTGCIEKEYNVKRFSLIDKFKTLKSKISLVIDCWTSSNQIAFQGVVSRFIDENWIMNTIPIDVTPLLGPHSGDNIADALFSVIEQFGITSNILSITTDNATNMDTFFDSFQNLLESNGLQFDPLNQRVRCLAHIVNLCAKDIMNVFENNISTMGSIDKLHKGSNGIRSTPQRREGYYRHCHDKETDHGKLLPILDVRTRWNSTFDMIERALKIKTPYSACLRANSELRRFCLTEPEWDQLKQLMDFMSPLKEATLMISKETTPNITSTTMIYHYLLQHFEKYTKSGKRGNSKYSGWLMDAAHAGLEKLEKYYPQTDGKVYVIGTILHPGFKLEWYKRANWPQEWVNNCKSIITNEWNEFYKDKSLIDGSLAAHPTSEKMDFFSTLYNSQMSSAPNAPADELKKYLSEPVVKEGVSGSGFLQWWKNKEHEFPLLSKMAKDYLAVAGSGVPVERLFSIGTDVLSDDRHNLTSDHIRMIMCLKCWINNDG